MLNKLIKSSDRQMEKAKTYFSFAIHLRSSTSGKKYHLHM